jgi:hypothetical protein
MTALMFQNRVELRANSDGRVLSTDHSSFVAGNPVGIDLPQHMLLFGPETGHVIAWPIPK